MKVSFIVPARNKAKHVAACVRSVLRQTYSPMEIVFSDQGSEDETLAIIRDLAAGYAGPNTVRVLQCPDIERRGMPGLNAHMNWLDGQIEGDVVIQTSADDICHPDRARRTVAAFKKFNPSYVNTTMQFVDPTGEEEPGLSNVPNRGTRWIGVDEAIRHQVGSNGSSAWARDLYQKYGPLEGYEQQDMILPMMALIERGIYFIDLPLHTYVKHASLDNTGFQGRMAAARSDEERARLVEINNFAHVRNWTSIFERWQKAGRVPPESVEPLMEKITTTSHAWAGARETLLLAGLQSHAG